LSFPFIVFALYSCVLLRVLSQIFIHGLFGVCSLLPITPEQERETETAQLHGGPLSPGPHADWHPLVCGISLELPSCGSTDGGARGAKRPGPQPALGRAVESPPRSCLAVSPALGGAQRAPARDVQAAPWPGGCPVSACGEDGADARLPPDTAPRRTG